MDFIDLHTHTCYSYGTSTVENSLKCADMRAQNVMGYSGGDRILMQPWMRGIKNRYI